MNKLIFTFFAVLALSACTKDDSAKDALEAAGYTNITITGYSMFGCDKNDDFHTGFEATGQNGKKVSGVVCSGLLKGSTIRTN